MKNLMEIRYGVPLIINVDDPVFPTVKTSLEAVITTQELINFVTTLDPFRLGLSLRNLDHVYNLYSEEINNYFQSLATPERFGNKKKSPYNKMLYSALLRLVKASQQIRYTEETDRYFQSLATPKRFSNTKENPDTKRLYSVMLRLVWASQKILSERGFPPHPALRELVA